MQKFTEISEILLLEKKMVIQIQKVDAKGSIRGIIERLTSKSRSVFLDSVIVEAGEVGIGESYVKQAIQQLKEENFVEEVFNSKLLRRIA